MRHVSRELTKSLLIGSLTKSNLEPKIPNQICWHLTTNSQTCLAKASFSRDGWNHLLCLFNIMRFSDVFWHPFQKFSLSLSSQIAPCDWCHVGTRTRRNLEWWILRWQKPDLPIWWLHGQCKEGCLATKIGTSGQSGEWRQQQKSWRSLRKLGYFGLELRSRKFPSESYKRRFI